MMSSLLPKILTLGNSLVSLRHTNLCCLNVRFFHSSSLLSNQNLSIKDTTRKQLEPTNSLDGSQSVIAYNLSEKLKIERAYQLLVDFDEYQITDTPRDLRDEAVVLNLKGSRTRDGSHRSIFLFRDGSIVFWGIPYEDQKTFLHRLSPLKVDPYSNDLIQNEREHLNFKLVKTIEKSRLDRETIQLASKQDDAGLLLDQFAISHAVVLSVKLGIWESTLEQYIDSVGWVTTSMRKGERIRLTRDQVFRRTGEIYELKHRINLTSDLLDLPDIYWDRHNQEVIFLSIISFLNLRRRTTVINEKLNNCCELMNLLAGHMNDQHHIRLEWMIIALIMVEIQARLVSVQIDKMFAALLKDHQKAQEDQKTEINAKRVAAEKSIESLTSKSVKDLNEGVAKAYLNQHKLDNETRKLRSNVVRLTKQAQQWIMVCNNLNEAVKDIGDISIWTKTIENDVQFVARAIEDSHRPLNTKT